MAKDRAVRIDTVDMPGLGVSRPDEMNDRRLYWTRKLRMVIVVVKGTHGLIIPARMEPQPVPLILVIQNILVSIKNSLWVVLQEVRGDFKQVQCPPCPKVHQQDT